MELTLVAMAAFQLLRTDGSRRSISGPGADRRDSDQVRLCATMLIGYTGHGNAKVDWSYSFNSPYHFILAFASVISAATSLGAWGTVFFTIFAVLEYSSFYLFIDQNKLVIPPEEWPHVWLRIVTYPLLAVLTFFLAEENRKKARDAEKAAAAQLAEGLNRSLQAAEDAVRRSDRLAALGQLTAGLAHELRNPLSTIKSSSEILSTSLPAGNEVAHELAGFISSEVDRTNSLITRFLDLARPQLRPETADVTRIIDQAIERLEKRSPAFDITIHKNYSPDVPELAVDPELMGLVFYNLASQSQRRHRPRGRPSTIKTRLANSKAEVAVIDRGSGVKIPRIWKNIFNPRFLATKSDGVGLGLAIVSKIVDEHKGKITVDSTPKEGSVFHVFLPARWGERYKL